jgi:ferredoxin
MTVPTTRAGLERGFGTREPEVVGISLDEVAVKYKPSNGGILFNIPPVITRIFGRYYTVRPCIDASNKDGKLRIDNERCILCYCCREMCPENAVASDRSLLARILTNA